MRQPDKLFREKFEHYRKPAPAAAWSRIEGELDKKNGKPFWLKVAAAVTILASAGAIAWLSEFAPADPRTAATSQQIQTQDKPSDSGRVSIKLSGEKTPDENIST
ncbi:MAG TPA: hypothetical protein VEB86_05410, partial [Chryseosolibacter sp.]|nr:hypothetical protein [Chryseosolibacter sp.]